MRVKINSTGEIKEVKQVGDKLFDKKNNCYLLGQVTVLEDWHPASELPPVGENGSSTDVIAIDEDNEPIKVSYSKFYKCWVMADVTAESFDKIKIKRWCYPPEE